MSPLGICIMAIKRRRAIASEIGDRREFWKLTDQLNKLVGGEGFDASLQ